MKKFAINVVFILAFAIGCAGCIFEDVSDEDSLAVCALVGFCLVLYAVRCVFGNVKPEDEEEIAKHLTQTEIT